MTTTVNVLALGPADLAGPLPPWELQVGAGELGVAVIDGAAADWQNALARQPGLARELQEAPVITVGVVRGDAGDLVKGCDLIATPDGVEALLDSVTRAGAPALVTAQLLREPTSAVAVESFAYSMLLWSEDFRTWRGASEPGEAHDRGETRVTVERAVGAWKLTLTRPDRHNAFDALMREQLCDALDALATAPAAPVAILGSGPSFCSGGDLDEFGTAASPIAAHLVRSGRSVARRLSRLRPRLVAGVHGRCIGAGVEFAAFATRVIATPDATFALPELSLGLGLGAGGSASIPARIGRQRTLELLLADEPLDASAALRWGLADEIAPEDELEARCLEAAEALA